MPYTTKTFDEKIVSLLESGAVGFMPSDTVYGLSAHAMNESAMGKIYGLKQRHDHKPCIILLSDIAQSQQIGVDSEDLRLVGSFWPAPLTVILTAEDSPPYLHRGLKTLAVRIPNNKELRELIGKVGPIVSTSANIQNQPTARTVDDAKKIFGEELDFYVDIGPLTGKPSTIVEFKNGKLCVLRQGAWQIPSQTL